MQKAQHLAPLHGAHEPKQVLCFQESDFQVPQNNQVTGEPCFQPIENSQFAPNTLRGVGVGSYFPITSIGTVIVFGGMQALSSQAW
jgi:hypothetical protein